MVDDVFADIANYIAVASGVAAIVYLIVVARKPDANRVREDDDRAFFDRHGRWPDEPEEAAVPRVGGYAAVDEPRGEERRRHSSPRR